MSFDIISSIRINDFNQRRIKDLVEWFNIHDENELEYTASDIVRIAINRLYKEKIGVKNGKQKV